MSHDKIIKNGDSSFIVKTQMPSTWIGNPTAVTISIYDTAGTTLVDAESVTLYAGDVSSAIAYGGTDSIALTINSGYTPKQGDHVRIGNSSVGYQNVTVVSYTAATTTIVIDQFLKWDMPAGIEINWRDMSHTIDASGTDWSNVKRVEIIWSPDTDDVNYPELWDVLKAQSAGAGLEQSFETFFSRYYENIEQNTFVQYEKRARDRLYNLFESRQRNMDKIVDSSLLDDLVMTEIAILICLASGTDYDDELKKLKADKAEQLAIIDGLEVWVDEDEDNIVDDGEEGPAVLTGIARGI